MTARPVEGIYELLDITPDASPALAHEMYWRKLQPYITRSDDSSESHSETIEALNQALAIVLDARLRAEYDAAHPNELRQHAADLHAPRAARRSAIVIVGTTAIVSLVLYGVFGPLASLLPLPITFVALLLAQVRAATLTAEPAFAALHLRATATQEQIELAYRVRAQQILLRIRRDPRVISELDALDKAYVRAMTITLNGAGNSAGQRAGAPFARWIRPAAGTTLAMLQGALERGGSFALRSAHDIRAVTQRDVASRGVTPNAANVEVPEIDLQHRLSAGLKNSAEHVALAVSPPTSGVAVEPERGAVTASLLLESAMGTRRVQLGERPVSIGTSPNCDLALPEQEGIEPEHALVWQHGSRIVLHADLNATCFVNEEPVTWALLEDGDLLRVGTYNLRISAPAG